MIWELTTADRRKCRQGSPGPLRRCIEQLEVRQLLSVSTDQWEPIAITVSPSFEVATLASSASDKCGLDRGPINGPFASRPTTVASFTTHGSREYTTAALADGSSLTVWADTGSERSGIFGQRFDRDGTAMGPELAVILYPAAEHGWLRQVVMNLNVASLETRGFVTTWKDREGIHVILSTASGANLELPIHESKDHPTKLHDPNVVSTGDGEFFVAWTNASTNRVRGQKYDHRGTPVGGVVDLIKTSKSTEIRNLKVLAHPVAGIIVQWTAADYVGTSRYRPTSIDHYYRRFDTSGVAAGPPTAIAIDSDATRPAMAINGSGDMVTVFRRTVDNRVGTYVQWLDADGSTRATAKIGSVTGAALEVRPTSQNTLDSRLLVGSSAVSIVEFDLAPSVGALSDDGFVITFFDDNDHGTMALARQYGPSGQHVGSPRPIASDVRLNRSPLKSTPLASGGFATTWTQMNRDPAEIALVTQLHAGLPGNSRGDVSDDCHTDRRSSGSPPAPVFDTVIENRVDENPDDAERSGRLRFVTSQSLTAEFVAVTGGSEPIPESAAASSTRRRSSVDRVSPHERDSNIYRAADSAGRALTKQSTEDTRPDTGIFNIPSPAAPNTYFANLPTEPTLSDQQQSSSRQLRTIPIGEPLPAVSQSFPSVPAARQRALLDQAMSHSARALLTPFTNTLIGVATAFDDEVLFQQLDAIQETVMDSAVLPRIVVGTAIVAATGFSAVQFAWMLRGSLLATKLMSTMPIWISFDPLPVLDSFRDGEAASRAADGPDESLADIAQPQFGALNK